MILLIMMGVSFAQIDHLSGCLFSLASFFWSTGCIQGNVSRCVRNITCVQATLFSWPQKRLIVWNRRSLSVCTYRASSCCSEGADHASCKKCNVIPNFKLEWWLMQWPGDLRVDMLCYNGLQTWKHHTLDCHTRCSSALFSEWTARPL